MVVTLVLPLHVTNRNISLITFFIHQMLSTVSPAIVGYSRILDIELIQSICNSCTEAAGVTALTGNFAGDATVHRRLLCNLLSQSAEGVM